MSQIKKNLNNLFFSKSHTKKKSNEMYTKRSRGLILTRDHCSKNRES
jgi:hypothetical protein